MSGRDQNAVTKTISGLLKLIQPDGSTAIPDEELEWAVRLALEMRRRVKEQQKRIGTAEFRNTQFSYSLGADGVEHFVATPELQSEDSIGGGWDGANGGIAQDNCPPASGTLFPARPNNVPVCALQARFSSGGRFHPDKCRIR